MEVGDPMVVFHSTLDHIFTSESILMVRGHETISPITIWEFGNHSPIKKRTFLLLESQILCHSIVPFSF